MDPFAAKTETKYALANVFFSRAICATNALKVFPSATALKQNQNA